MTNVPIDFANELKRAEAKGYEKCVINIYESVSYYIAKKLCEFDKRTLIAITKLCENCDIVSQEFLEDILYKEIEKIENQ